MQKFINFIVALTLVGAFSSCSMSKLMDKNPEKAAEQCAFRFPVQERVVTVDSLVHDTITDIQVLEQPAVEIKVPCPPSAKATTVTAKCPPCRDSIIYRTKTLQITKTTAVRDRAYETVLTNERDDARRRLDRANGWLKVCLWILIPLIIAVLIWAYMRIRAGALNSVIKKLKS